jgi:hypothetical protein
VAPGGQRGCVRRLKQPVHVLRVRGGADRGERGRGPAPGA